MPCHADRLSIYPKTPDISTAVYSSNMDRNTEVAFLKNRFFIFCLMMDPNNAQVDVAINAVSAKRSADTKRTPMRLANGARKVE